MKQSKIDQVVAEMRAEKAVVMQCFHADRRRRKLQRKFSLVAWLCLMPALCA